MRLAVVNKAAFLEGLATYWEHTMSTQDVVHVASISVFIEHRIDLPPKLLSRSHPSVKTKALPTHHHQLSKMCWTTLLIHKCNVPSCPSPSMVFKKTLAVAPCCHVKDLNTHIQWPRGCSYCIHDPNTKNWSHSMPIDHLRVEENALVTRRSICPTCREAEGVEELNISKSKSEKAIREEFLQPRDLAKIFCTILKIPNPRTADLAGAIADAVEPIRQQNGVPPHAFTAACLYAASWIAPCPRPVPVDWLVEAFNMKSRTWFLHAYTSLFNHRHLISDAGVINHRAFLGALPKPCCHYPQNRHCLRVKNQWGYDESRCAGNQVEGPHVLGAFVSFRNFLHDIGVPVNDPKKEYYRESDLELLRNERTQEQIDNPPELRPQWY